MADAEEVTRDAALAAVAEIENNVKDAEEKHDEEEATETPLHDEALKHCPCCSWDLSNMNLPVPAEDDKKEYVRCVMAKKQFGKTYPLFDGAVTAKYQLLKSNKSKDLQRALRSIPDSDNMIQRTTQALKVKLLFYLAQLNDDTFEPPETAEGDDLDSFEYWEGLYDARFGEYSEDVPILLTRVLMEFTRLAEMLPSAGLDENFWKGAGLA